MVYQHSCLAIVLLFFPGRVAVCFPNFASYVLFIYSDGLDLNKKMTIRANWSDKARGGYRLA